MDAENWAKAALFIWLFAYSIFFFSAWVLLTRKRTIPRWLIFGGTLCLFIVNLMLLGIYNGVPEMTYSPIYEEPSHSFPGSHRAYPEWERYYYWSGVLLDTFGKLLAGIGLIAEARQQVAMMRYRQMQLAYPELQHTDNKS